MHSHEILQNYTQIEHTQLSSIFALHCNVCSRFVRLQLWINKPFEWNENIGYWSKMLWFSLRNAPFIPVCCLQSPVTCKIPTLKEQGINLLHFKSCVAPAGVKKKTRWLYHAIQHIKVLELHHLLPIQEGECKIFQFQLLPLTSWIQAWVHACAYQQYSFKGMSKSANTALLFFL